MLPRAAMLCLLWLSACEKKAEPAPVPAPAPPPPAVEVGQAEVAEVAEELKDAGAAPAKPPCPLGKFYVHGGCYSSDDVGVAGPKK